MYRLEINKNLIPYKFNILLNNELFELRVDYNNKADLFTVSLYKDNVELCVGEPIIYGMPLFGDLQNRGNFPRVVITPIDESGESNAVTYDNLSTTVFLNVSVGDEVE